MGSVQLRDRAMSWVETGPSVSVCHEPHSDFGLPKGMSSAPTPRALQGVLRVRERAQSPPTVFQQMEWETPSKGAQARKSLISSCHHHHHRYTEAAVGPNLCEHGKPLRRFS